MKIVYVALHYNAYEMTCECIECLKKIVGPNSEIVIVDNNSPNNSGALLLEKYKDDSMVHILISDQNLGFARGNNIGYRYAKEQLGADVIVDMNNDVLIYQDDFEKVIETYYNSPEKIAVIAPNIINKKGFFQNPYRVKRELSTHLIKSIILHIIYFYSLSTGVFRDRMYERYHRDDQSSRARNVSESEIENVVPHGSCLVFMKPFIEKSDNAFVPITFFYAEEDILYDYLMIHNLKSIYSGKIEVHHMEKVATNTVSEAQIEREKFQVKNKIVSKWNHLLFRINNKIL